MSVTLRRLAFVAAAALVATAVQAPAARADGPEQIVNGTFDSGATAPWWGTANITLAVSEGRLCADVPGGTANPWDVIIGQDNIPLVTGETYAFRFFATATPAKVAKALIQLPVDPYTQYLSANPELSVSGNDYTYTFTSGVDLPNAQVAFQIGGSADPWRICLDNVSLTGGAEPEEYVPDTGPRVRVNQVGYLPKGPKNATVVTEATDAAAVAAEGRRAAPSSRRGRHHAARPGRQLRAERALRRLRTVREGGHRLHPRRRRRDQPPVRHRLGGSTSSCGSTRCKFYYTQRSGLAIRDDLRPGVRATGRPRRRRAQPRRHQRAVPARRL